MTQLIKALDETCLHHAGSLLLFQVHYGYGWKETKSEPLPGNWRPVEPPAHFHLRIQEFFPWRGVIGGGIAQVEEDGHILNGCWALFIPRTLGISNLTDNLTTYTISTGITKPVLLDITTDPDFPEYSLRWRFLSGPEMLGFGVIAADPKYLKQWEQGTQSHPSQISLADWGKAKDFKRA